MGRKQRRRSRSRQDYLVYKELELIIEEMNREVDAVIVEGSHDRAALEEMGFRKDMLLYSESKLSDGDFVELVSKKYERVVILTDYDRDGKYFNKKLSERLQQCGVCVEHTYRDKIGKLLGLCGIRDIESMSALRKRFL
ncbi:MAG: toprim domain-containing protein [Candidatus Alkanophagales archaeon]